MQKFFCAIGFLIFALIFQDCLVPAQGVRVRVVKVKRQDNHYTKRQVSRTTYTDVPLTGDPDPDAESFQVSSNSLRPDYNNGNRRADYPINTNYIPPRNEPIVPNYEESYGHQQQPASGQRNRYESNNGNSRGFTGNDRGFPGAHSNVVNNNRGFVPPSNQDSEVVVSSDGGRRPSADQQRPKEKEGDCPGCGNSIPGEAGVDYPNYHSPPKTQFLCSKQSYSGYYADVEARCQVFWICQKNRADAFLCPNGTIFNQQVFVCDWWFNSDCNTATDYYSRNQYLYAGPTVDLFGNPVTPYKQPSTPSPLRARATASPIRIQAADQQPAPDHPVRQTQPPSRSQQSVLLKQSAIPQQQKQQSAPQRQPLPPPGLVQPPRQQQQQQASVPQTQQRKSQQRLPNNNNVLSGGYGSGPASIRRNDFEVVAATAVAPISRQYPPPAALKRSQQAAAAAATLPQNNNKNYRNERVVKQNYNNYPVPDNSLAAVDQEFGLKMNNYKAAVDYINQEEQQLQRQKNSYPSQKYYAGTINNNNNNNAGYTQQQQQQPRQSGYTQVPGGYGSRIVVASQRQQQPEEYQRQPLFSSAEYEVDASEGFGTKKQRSNIIVEQNALPQEVTPLIYSSTTKRNAIDYDTENTTPYTISAPDEDLIGSLTTPRYGEVVSRPSNSYSTETEVAVQNSSAGSSQETTTTPAPLTFGQKLTRAAKKRGTTNWGNWRTMLLGDY